MQYLLMIYEEEALNAQRSEQELGEIFTEFAEFTEQIKQSGKLLGGNALESVGTATTVRIRDGKTVTTDGPFAETKEQLGGYYLVDAENLDEALSIAARIPTAKSGSIEVRPVMLFE